MLFCVAEEMQLKPHTFVRTKPKFEKVHTMPLSNQLTRGAQKNKTGHRRTSENSETSETRHKVCHF